MGEIQHDIDQTGPPSDFRARCGDYVRCHTGGCACLRAGGDRRADGAAAAARRGDAGAACRLRLGSGALALGARPLCVGAGPLAAGARRLSLGAGALGAART
ncbi:hypothetical protein PQQ86_29920 [Paraburkholderia sediminicola]